MMQQLSEAFIPHFTSDRVVDLALIALKSTIIYLFLVVGLRLLGKHSLGQMTVYDLILVIVLANSVQNAMVGEDTTIAGGMVSAITLIALNRIFTAVLVRSSRLEQVMVGSPVLLLQNGQLLRDAMAHEHVSEDQILEACREHGMESIDAVNSCVLEVDGTMSIVPQGVKTHRTKRRVNKALRVQ